LYIKSENKVFYVYLLSAMTKIGILSDTHGYVYPSLKDHFSGCDEIWHAGDVGDLSVIKCLTSFGKPIRGVYGNIDGPDIRERFGEKCVFMCEGVKVLMVHIGGYPPKYNKRSLKMLEDEKPQLMITGHSHILKILFDERLNCLHINPGAAGKQGWQKFSTIVLMTIDGMNMRDCRVIELK
jgi:hypothetical protein